ncbi:CAZyme family GH16 [Penicillium psychrosexuale]|uniref:CAZyme family GH16 n=1 Tax=Penicillium psychrosexuale TaxID=1002107 RepID=UPI0025458734|nr:CAZyme family GH16 [Penicillium psychrosexuale]KAJ5803787.1 CAZyme family GH16 [Penicillium psychrosexuale]
MDNQQLPFLNGDSGANPSDPTLELKSPANSRPWYNPLGWSLLVKLLVSTAAIVIILLVAILVPYQIVSNRYPNYTPLNYTLVDTYSGPNFFEQFTYFTDEDPTKGFVVYVNKTTARHLNLTYASETSAILRADASTPNTRSGRNSVRIESRNTYGSGLFIFDIIHTPFGCATWPALWLTDGYSWPTNGEIDVLETTNIGSHGNEISIHTTKGCNMDVKRKHTGQAIFKNCDNSTNGNSGCAVIGDEYTYGEAMNNRGGGVYALELRDAGIRAWLFPRGAVPADVAAGNPDPSSWGVALADFPSTNCDIATHFKNLSIIVNIDLCGELAAQKQFYETMYHCPATCSSFVANNPGEFVDAYWEFNSFKVYRAY